MYLMTKTLLFVVLASALAGIGIRLGSAPFVLARNENAIRRSTPPRAGFSHPLVFPPVNTGANVSIGINEGCVQILDGPCTNMWTYGGTYPGLTIRRPTGQRTSVTFTNNLGPEAGEMTIHNHGNHSSANNDGQPNTLLIPTGASRTYTY